MNDNEENIPAEFSYGNLAVTLPPPQKDKGVLFATLGVMGVIAAFGFNQKRKKV
jgi:hypothetical protein